jgi:uncharacterized membrane protein
MHKLFSQAVPVVLVIFYPLLVHLSIVLNVPPLQALAISFFLGGILYKPLLRFELTPWLVLIAVTLFVLLLSYINVSVYLLYVPPVLIPLLLLFVFGRTLINGREPLVTAIGEASRGPLSTEMRIYTRRVTQFWCAIFIMMALWSLILPLLAHPKTWSWFTNIINYGLVGILFVGEFILRKKIFPTHNHPNFIEYLRIIATANIRL